MVSLIKTQEEYKNWLSRVSHLFKQSQIKASMKVNSEMLRFYWLLGMDIKSLDLDGYSVAELLIKVSHDLQNIFPDVHVFSKTNLWYMLKFYELYAPILKIPQVGECHLMQKITIPQVGEFSIENIFCIPWGHTKLIIDKCRKDSKKAIYYTMKVLENNWSRAILMNFIDSNLYEREGKAITNFNTTLPEAQGELAQALTRDPYNFDFLTLSQKSSALIENVPLAPGVCYSATGDGDHVGIIRIEVVVVPGNGKITITGTTSNAIKEDVKNTVNYIKANEKTILDERHSLKETDLNIQVTNVLGNNTTVGIGGAIYVGILSALYKKNLKAGLVVIGNVTIGGAVERVVQFADKVSSLADNGAKMVIVPMDNISELATIPTTVLSKCDVPFYNNAQVLLQKAME